MHRDSQHRSGDALVDLFYSLRAPYRQNAVWMGSSDTARLIRKFKDGQGNYLWQPATSAGQPDLLLGKPWVTNEFMPAVGANAFPLAVGDFSRGYIIVDRVGIRILRDPYPRSRMCSSTQQNESAATAATSTQLNY